MHFVIVTGMSGAGKSTALKILEDAGYFCVDNLPIALISKFAELTKNPNEELEKFAIGVDIRSGQSLESFEEILEELATRHFKYEILFLDASDDVLVKRYKETRRSHPLAQAERVDRGIEMERKKLEFLKKQADIILDTTNLLTRELKQEIEKIVIKDEHFSNMMVTVLSFGFKYGIPNDSDLVFDVRFLPNPYYIDELKTLTGMQSEVQEFVLKWQQTKEFLDKLYDMVSYLVPYYQEEGKSQLVIAIGCTGGMHRSVTITEKMYEKLLANKFKVIKHHRDIEKDGNK